MGPRGGTETQPKTYKTPFSFRIFLALFIRQRYPLHTSFRLKLSAQMREKMPQSQELTRNHAEEGLSFYIPMEMAGTIMRK